MAHDSDNVPPEDAQDQFYDLCLRYFERDLGDAEFEELNRLLRNDPACRAAFIELSLQMEEIADVHAGVEQEPVDCAAPAASRPPREQHRGPFARRRAWFVPAIAAAAALLAALPAVIWLSEEDAGVVSSQPTPRTSSSEVAVLTAVNDPAWDAPAQAPQVSQSLSAGSLALRSGVAQIDFFGGATLVLRGPVELSLLSPHSVSVRRGMVTAHLHRGGDRFTLVTPALAVANAGAAFEVTVLPDGTTELHAQDAPVEVSLLGEDGATLQTRRLAAYSGLSARPNQDIPLVTVPVPQLAPAEEKPAQVTDLHISPEYVQAVLSSNPLAYWRFERIVDDHVPNEVGGRHGARVMGALRLTAEAENRAADFGAYEQQRWLEIDDGLALGDGSYTVELWAKPTSFGRTALVGLVAPPPAGEPKGYHLGLLQFQAMPDEYMHRPGVVRFLHRSPPAEFGGVNVFSRSHYLPGRWNHIVAVREADRLSLYLNGKLSRTVRTTTLEFDQPLKVVIGNLIAAGGKQESSRQFVGELDEIAMYPHALTEAQVQQHYRLATWAGDAATPPVLLGDAGRFRAPAPHLSDASLIAHFSPL